MRTRLIVGWVVLLSLVAAIGYAQNPSPASAPSRVAPVTPPSRTLGLAEALDIARRNSPELQQARNDRWGSSMQATSSLYSLFVPEIDISGSRGYSAAGSQSPGFGPPQPYPAETRYNWSLGAGYRFSGRAVANRGLASANLRAVEQDIQSATTLLETGVRFEYLTLLQNQAQADLARRSLERAQQNLDLASARYSVGQGTLIDVRSAEVGRGQAEVTLLRADQTTENQVLRLFGRLGIPAPETLSVLLTDSFPVTNPTWNQQQLVSLALDQNPGLLSLRARRESARWGVRAAKSDFLPSLSLNAGLAGGYRRESVIDTNSVPGGAGPPLPITSRGSNPFGFSISASVPIVEPFGRNVSVQNARANADDLAQAIRARELSVRSDVVAAYHAVLAAYRTIDLQRANKVASAEALDLATQRYRVGSGTYLELLDARVTADRADADYITAVYDYHKSIATLENAVGRPLR